MGVRQPRHACAAYKAADPQVEPQPGNVWKVVTFGASEDNPVSLKFCGHVAIGESPEVVVKKGLVAEIVTGAPLPDGADAVVMVEHSTRKEDSVFVHRPVTINENLMATGSDIRKNETVLKSGRFLGSREIGVLAAIGLRAVSVYKRPKVAVLSTGSEVVAPGEALPYGKIYDINAHDEKASLCIFSLCSLLTRKEPSVSLSIG